HRRSLRRRQRGGIDGQRAEQPVLFAVDPSSEEEGAGGGTRDAQAELESPDPWDFDRLVVGIADRAKELPRVEVKRIDTAVTEVADKGRVVEIAEALEGCPGHPPRRVELALAGEPPQQVPIRVKNVNEPVSWPGNIVFLIGVLQSVGYVEMAVD